MTNSIQKHLPKIVFGHGILFFLLIIGGALTFTFHGPLAALLASATSSLSGSPAVMYFTPYGENTLSADDIADIDLNINAKTPINAVGATITYPPDDIEIVGINKTKSFMDLWTEDTVIKESLGEVHFSGGTTKIGGLTGTGTVLTLSVRAKKDAAIGNAKLNVEGLQILASDGKGTELDSNARSFAYVIIRKEPAARPATGGESGGSAPAQPPVPSADFNGDGKITIVDMSILTVHMMLMSYDPRYDLDIDGKIGLSDLSILFSKM